MCINDILENEELRKLLNNSIGKTYYKFKLSFIIDMEDFEQEVYVFLITRIKNFDSQKSSLKTYIPMVVMSCARTIIQLSNGSSKDCNKLEFRNNTVSLEGTSTSEENLDFQLIEVLGKNDTYSSLIIDDIIENSSLSDKQKLVIKLLSKGFTVKDISLMLNKTTSCINITYQRAKEKIVRKYAY